MATFNFKELKTKYEDFLYSIALVLVDGNNITDNKHGFFVSDIDVEVTSDFEASIATFGLYGTYSMNKSAYLTKEVSKLLSLGSLVEIYMGYASETREVFRGFVSNVSFVYEQGETPGILVTAMDIKGIMMSGNYSAQLKSDNYGDAVKEILKRTNYEKLSNMQMITSLNVSDTPDKAIGGEGGGQKGESDKTLEMVAESDYEFVVKAAKKFNYEFFSIGGYVYFRKAKSDPDILIELGPHTTMRSVNLTYDITGLAGSVEVRGMDVGKSKVISSQKKINNKISLKTKAKGLVSSVERVYLDPTVRAKEDADYRAEYLSEDIAYRFGTLKAVFQGLPEIIPGRFISLKLLGDDMDMKFYVVSVRHVMNDDGYVTHITAKSCNLEPVSAF